MYQVVWIVPHFMMVERLLNVHIRRSLIDASFPYSVGELFRFNNLIKERILELFKYLRIFGCHIY